MESLPIYQLRVPEVYQALESSPNGLLTDEADARRSLYGHNQLEEPPPTLHWQRMGLHLAHPMALILWIAGALALLAREPFLTGLSWTLVVVNAGFSFWREYRAEQAMQALRRLLPAYARLVRDGKELLVPAFEVVPGDVLILAEGDNISADARVVEEYGLRTNNANLTGEAVPARKSADASLREGVSELERPNLIFAGTSIVSGTGRAVVYSTGMMTQFGRIAHLTQAVHEGPSHLQREMVRITRMLSLIAVSIGGIVLVVGLTDVGLTLPQTAVLAIGIIIGVIPEGLPATMTLSLAMAGQRLATRGVLIKKLSILEILGTISVIATDKSGTLTQNQMTVRDVWVARRRLKVTGVGYEPKGEYQPNPAGEPFDTDLKILLAAAALANNSRLNPPTPDHPTWTCLGDQTEAAMRCAALKGGIDDIELNRLYPRVHELPFDARRKRMTTIHRDLRGDVAFVKGAPREVLQLCTHILIHGEVRLLTAELRAEVMAANDDYARGALRVLALARRELPVRPTGPSAPAGRAYSIERIENDLTFLGLMAMMDPPRPEVAEAVRVCRQAGIRMVMITGDYGLTAESLARRVGMLLDPSPRILTGAELDEIDDHDLDGVLSGGEVIFARMAPEHKLRLVAAFQNRGEVVAVTGDGVNDAPALRKADVGVAMGLVGTDVAKEAADIILTNDNFASIIAALEEGRAVYDNIRKFITYIFSSNVPEVLPFLLAAGTQSAIPLALSALQILAIDMGTDLLPGLALGSERPEPDVMRRPPRRRSQRLIDTPLMGRAFLWLGLIEAGLCFAGFFLVLGGLQNFPWLDEITQAWFSRLGIGPLSPAQTAMLASTVYFAGVVTAQVGNAFASRTEKNRGRSVGWFSNRTLLIGIALQMLMILVLVYFPPTARLFGLLPLPPVYWIGLIGYAFVIYSFDRIRKSIARRLSQKPFGLDVSPGNS
jgi:magnesium-transporting ATPase (P-type)